MSYLLPHLHSGFAVDQAILSVSAAGWRLGTEARGRSGLHRQHAGVPEPCCCTLPWAQEEDRCVIIRFGHDYDETCMQMDEVGWPLVCVLAAAACPPPAACRQSALRFASQQPCPLCRYCRIMHPAPHHCWGSAPIAGSPTPYPAPPPATSPPPPTHPPPLLALPPPSCLPPLLCRRSWRAPRSA
jgi:hypothetical protein